MIDLEQFRSFDDFLREELKDPAEAKAYLEFIIKLYEQDGDTDAFLMALRSIAEAQGGLSHLAGGKNLSHLFSRKGNPRIGKALHDLGFQQTIKSLTSHPPTILH